MKLSFHENPAPGADVNTVVVFNEGFSLTAEERNQLLEVLNNPFILEMLGVKMKLRGFKWSDEGK